MLDIKRWDNLEAFHARDWDALLPPDALYLSHAHLRAIGQCEIGVKQFQYVMFLWNNAPIGGAILYCVDTPLSVFWPRQLSAEQLRRESPQTRWLSVRTVECGIPSAIGRAVFWRRPEDANKVLSGLTDAMWAFADEMNCKTLIVRDMDEGSASLAREHCGDALRLVSFFPDTMLDIRWKNWDDYLSSLRKRYRQRIRYNQDAFQKAGITTEHRTEFGGIVEELHELYLQVYARATELRRERLTPAYFAAFNACMGERSSVQLYKQGDRIVGFDLLLHDAETLRCLYTGFDYRVNETARLYLNSYVENIKLAIQHSIRKVEWGLSSYPAKLALGAKPVPLQFGLLHRSNLIGRILKGVFAHTLGAKKLPEYRVFRDHPSAP